MLALRSFAQWVAGYAAAAQSAAAAALDFSVGSVNLAAAEANAGLALWIQWLLVVVLAKTRAATSNGPDLDSWMADFSQDRLPAVAAVGPVTFARFSLGQAAVIPIGATVLTADQSQSFAVVPDSTNPAYSPASNGYLLPANTATLIVPVEAVTPGTAGNVSAGAIALISTAIPGVDTVTNPAAFTSGVAAESDPALRARFANYINTRSRATLAAIRYAVQSTAANLLFSVQENVTQLGAVLVGNFVVTVDDGSGDPPDATLAAVYSNVDLYRPIGSTFEVQGPAVVNATITFTLTVAAGYVRADLLGPAETGVSVFVDALAMGAPLPYGAIYGVVKATSPGITDVTVIRVNSGTANIGGGAAQVVRAISVTAS